MKKNSFDLNLEKKNVLFEEENFLVKPIVLFLILTSASQSQFAIIKFL